MTSRQRLTKQIIIAAIFFLIVGSVGFWIYRIVNPLPPPPTPNPTANLAPIRILSTKFLNIENNDYDFVAKVSNPNTDYGSGDAEYELSFYNAAGNQISQKRGSFYILPGETRYILETPLKFQEPISRADLVIKSVDWQQLDPLSANGVQLIPRNVSYSQTNQAGSFGKVGGSIQNESNFDLGAAEVLVVLYDENGSIIAVNRTNIQTFLAHTSRGFETTWYVPFVGLSGQGQPNRTDVEAHTNVFENSNFTRQYQKPERFQQYY